MVLALFVPELTDVAVPSWLCAGKAEHLSPCVLSSLASFEEGEGNSAFRSSVGQSNPQD
jgi:hypothetical protein